MSHAELLFMQMLDPRQMSHLLVTRLRLRQRPKIMGPTVCDKNANHPDAKVHFTSTLPFLFQHTLAFFFHYNTTNPVTFVLVQPIYF